MQLPGDNIHTTMGRSRRGPNKVRMKNLLKKKDSNYARDIFYNRGNIRHNNCLSLRPIHHLSKFRNHCRNNYHPDFDRENIRNHLDAGYENQLGCNIRKGRTLQTRLRLVKNIFSWQISFFFLLQNSKYRA